MCVIFLSYKQNPTYPLILLANRDEFYDRPTEKAHNWKEYPEILAGKDKVSNGTWLGITSGGKYSAVTNYRDPNQNKGVISRGDLVADFLKSDIPPRDYLLEVQANADKYSGFNLLVGELNADRSELHYFSNRQNRIRDLQPGLYGLSNHLLDTPWWKVEKGKARLSELIKDPNLRKEPLFEILSDKSPADDSKLPDTGIGYEREKLLSSIFIETPVYGTRCSTILTFDKNLKADFEERVFV